MKQLATGTKCSPARPAQLLSGGFKGGAGLEKSRRVGAKGGNLGRATCKLSAAAFAEARGLLREVEARGTAKPCQRPGCNNCRAGVALLPVESAAVVSSVKSIQIIFLRVCKILSPTCATFSIDVSRNEF